VTGAGPPWSEGASLEARIATAFVRAAADVDFSSLELDTREPRPRCDRAAHRSSKPLELTARSLPGREIGPASASPRGGPRFLGVAAAVVALAMGAAALRHAARPEVDSGADSWRDPVRTIEVNGETVDPVLVDYLFPVDGDAWVVAKVRFGVAAALAKLPSVASCVRDRGRPGAEWLLIENAEEVGTAVMMDLPSLAVISRYWGERLAPLDSAEHVAALDCKGIDHSPASDWEDDAKQLLSLDHLPPAIAKVETTPVWKDARACMTEAGAPPDAPEIQRANLETAEEEIGEDLSNPPPGFSAYVSWIHDLPSARAFVWCMTPFFDEVEQVLLRPRAEFIERHRAELLELQRRFEALAGPGG
jgi:hypothetical protein